MGVTSRFHKLQSLKAHIPLNRYALLALYLIVVLLRGCTYWGWNGIQEMLYKSGAYLWECNDQSVVTELRIGNEKYVDCPVRKQLLGGIFTTALGSNMLSSFLAGVALDALGPKITLFIGILMDVVGWTLLGVSGEKFQAYYAAAFCIGVSADPGYLPLLSISKLFPKNSSFVISVMGSLRSISFSVPVIMSAIYQSAAYGPNDLWKMCIGYVGVGQGISLLVCLFFVPMKSFTTPVEEVEPEADETVKRQTFSSSSSRVQDKRSFWRLIVDPKFLLLVPIFCCALVRSDYYAKSNKEQLVEISSGKDLHQMFAIFNILSFIPGPVFGRITDVYGIVVVLFILNTMEHAFGKLTGLTSAVGGVFVLLSILWYKKVLEYEYPNNFIVVDGMMVGVGCVVYALVFVLWRITRREAGQAKVIDAQKTMTEYAEPTSTVSV
ncbi:hypothetical protein Esti_005441 [Eimeria stiedai]